MNEKHFIKQWEVSIIELNNQGALLYKVSRRMPQLHVAETKLFDSKEKAKEQFEEWLR